MRVRDVGLVLVCAVVPLATPGCTCNKDRPAGDDAAAAPTASGSSSPAPTPAGGPTTTSRFSAPIAAARVSGTDDVVVAGLDVAAKAIHAIRFDVDGATRAERAVLGDVGWTPDAELKVLPSAEALSVVWRGSQAGRRVRMHVVVRPDLSERVAPAPVPAAFCATQLGFVHADAAKVVHASFAEDAGAPLSFALPKDLEVALSCGARRAFVVLERDDGADLGVLDRHTFAKKALIRDAEVEGDARERAEYVVGDELGVVRLAAGGGMAWRETEQGNPRPVRKLSTRIPQEDDVVAVDASAKVVVIVYTHEVEGGCPGTSPMTKVLALRVDRATAAESVVELAPGTCGREIGPFYTSAAGEAVNVAWVERVPIAGTARPPIAGLGHASVPPDGPPRPFARLDVEADAIADAGCSATSCVAAALVRNEGTDGMVPGPIRILRYAP